MQKLVLATRNKGKVAEIKELLKDLPLEIVGLECFSDVPEVVENGHTFLDNALLKARTVAAFTGEITLADDSGLEVDYLQGAPGVHSARYGQPGWNDRQRYEYLLQQLEGVPEERRQGRFRSVVAVWNPAVNRSLIGEGKIDGYILTSPRGSNGFGYDPVFFVPEKGCAMAELAEAEKNKISHRSRAIQSIIPKLIEFTRIDKP